MSAADARLREAMTVLAGPAKKVLDLTLNGSSVPWLGSGISRDKFPSVPKLLEKLLHLLYSKATPADPNCPYVKAISEVLGMASGHSLDAKKNPASWDAIIAKQVFKELIDKYASILAINIQVGGRVVVTRWEILDLIAIYSDSSVTTDAEHYLIAILVAEGIWKSLVTTNWDALIEIADEEACSTGTKIQSIASNDELDATQNPNAPRLYKIHGCARKAASDPTTHQTLMIATEHDLARWSRDPQFAPIRDALSAMLRERAVLFIGLSGQDFNLKVELTSATFDRKPFDPAVPRVAFATQSLTTHHRTILTGVYLEDGYAAARESIEEMAAVPLYGKPMLGAIYAHTLFAKAAVALDASNEHIRPASIAWMKSLLPTIQDLLIEFYDRLVITPNGMWLTFVAQVPSVVSWFVSLYMHQRNLLRPRAYLPLYSGNIGQMREDASLAQRNFHWLIWSLCLFIEGGRRSYWNFDINAPSPGRISPTVVVMGARSRPILIVDDARQGAAKLLASDIITPSDHEAVIVYPRDQRPTRVARSPRRALTIRGSVREVTEVWLGDIYLDSSSDAEALDFLRMEIA